ncbi:hypothetical protein KI688_006902 [Linnemannia hyalina]|uniref:Uncharacterized protein n=1 Tax=Linnemannia hyalina TaxID=64524 RepID=A0A9P8BNE9_9FUNG|nr:hypothetical protein KI688_006902 [Linnemannia hyalina]
MAPTTVDNTNENKNKEHKLMIPEIMTLIASYLFDTKNKKHAPLWNALQGHEHIEKLEIHDAVFPVKELLGPKKILFLEVDSLSSQEPVSRLHPFLMIFVEKQVHQKSLELTQFKFTASDWKRKNNENSGVGSKKRRLAELELILHAEQLNLQVAAAVKTCADKLTRLKLDFGRGTKGKRWLTCILSILEECTELREFSYNNDATDRIFKEMMFKKPWNLPNFRKLHIHGVSPRRKCASCHKSLLPKDGDKGHSRNHIIFPKSSPPR